MGNRWQPPAFILLTLAPQRGRLQVKENLGDRSCGSEGEAAAQPASGGGAAQGEFPLSTLFSLCSSSSAGALTSSPWASPGWLPPLYAVALERMPLQGQGAAVRDGGVHHIPEVHTVHACMGAGVSALRPHQVSLCICRPCVLVSPELSGAVHA